MNEIEQVRSELCRVAAKHPTLVLVGTMLRQDGSREEGLIVVGGCDVADEQRYDEAMEYMQGEIGGWLAASWADRGDDQGEDEQDRKI